MKLDGSWDLGKSLTSLEFFSYSQMEYSGPPCSSRRRNSYDSSYYTESSNGEYMS